MSSSDSQPCLAVSPQGHLYWHPTGGDPWPVVAAIERIETALGDGPAACLIHLATREADTQLPSAPVFWRNFARLQLAAFCHRPESDDLLAPTPTPTDVTLQGLVDSAPPMLGGEYLSTSTLKDMWTALDEWVRRAAAETQGGVTNYMKALGPVWHMVGRVCFHLAEHRKNPDLPFAFLATYSSGLSAAGQLQHRPLAQALKEYAGEGNKEALIKLLTPVHRAAETCTLVKDLLESGGLFQALAWKPDQAYDFLKNIPLFERSGLVVRMPDKWGGKRPPRPVVGVRIGDKAPAGVGTDALLDFKVATTLEGNLLTPDEWQALLNASSGLVLIRGQWVEADPARLKETLAQWKDIEKAAAEGMSFSEAMRKIAGLDRDGDSATKSASADSTAWTGLQPGAWLEKTLAALRDPSQLKAGASHYGLNATLRPYQQSGVEWLRFMSTLGLGACLADDMGLGKTIQVIGLLMTARREQRNALPSLLVAPASLLANWQTELKRFAPELRHRILHPSELDPAAWPRIFSNPEAARRDCDLLMTTYGMVARWDKLRTLDWSSVIVDEAQAIKNPGARQTRAVKELKAARRIALTGTPIENRLGDLWSLFDFLNPGLLGSARQFSGFIKEAGANPARLGALRSLVKPYILRRLKTDKRIIADLPDKTEVKAYCGLTHRQAALYEQAVRELADKVETADGITRRGLILAFIMRFKQICNHPSQWLGDHAYADDDSGKFLRLREIATELAQRQEKALVFTQFQEMTAPLSAFLAGVFARPGLVLHGDTPIKERRRLVDTFQSESGPPFFILTTKAGGTGLNLTAASHVIHFDRWWNPAVENQATDRAFRIGQKRNVLVHKFICKGTFEEKIDALIEDKVALARDIVDGEGATISLTEMNNADLLRFVSLDIERAVEVE